MDTIYALASGAGLAGVAVYRISGPRAAAALTGLSGRAPPEPRRAELRRIRDAGGIEIDRGLVLWFPGPASFTGEDVVELHLHGGRAVQAALYRALGAVPGLRAAEPGEFTRRAFENGRLDLTQAEGLADLVAAETEGQRRQALRQMEGALGALYEGWRAMLVECLALLETDIDFVDEDLPSDGVSAEALSQLHDVAQAMRAHLADRGRGERMRDGVQVAILGAPNVGKSSLLNLLARRDAAIVADQEGTTRDVLEVALDLEGVPVVVADTAGLRESADPVEREGVRRARARGGAADIRLVVVDARSLGDAEDSLAQALEGAVPGRAIVVANKTDLASVPGDLVLAGEPVVGVSARTGEGIASLMARLSDSVGRCAGSAGSAVITRARHREAVAEASAALDRARQGGAHELVTEDVRLAVRALGRITGRVDVEEILDLVFSRFCIGK